MTGGDCQIVLKRTPVGAVNLDWASPDATFEMKQIPRPALKDGQVLLEVLYLSNDPTQRTWMNKPSGREYAPPILEGQMVRSLGVGRVEDSKSAKFAKGDLVSALLGWTTHAVVEEAQIWTKIDEKAGSPLPHYLGPLGMTGLTAYFGLTEIGQFKKGQSLIVDAASGATGSMVVQIAKKMFSASRVIAVTGSDDKCAWVKSLGADFAVNYKDPQYVEKLKDYIKEDFVDVLFDNVGGKILDSLMHFVKVQGRVVACGAIARYNDPAAPQLTQWPLIIMCRLHVQGFIVLDFMSKFPEGVAALVDGVKKGALKLEDSVTVIDLSKEQDPLRKVPETWNKLFGDNKPNGKLVTKIV